MSTPLNALILEDQQDDLTLLLRELRRVGFAPSWQQVWSEPDYLAALSRAADLDPAFDIILADYSMPNKFNAVRALQLLQAHQLDIPFLVLTGSISEEVAVECMKQGAADYLLKNHLQRLGPAVARALEQKQLRVAQQQAERAQRQAEEKYRHIFENAAEGIFQITSEGHLITANPALARMWGYPSTEALLAGLKSGDELYIEPSRWAEFMRQMEAQGAVSGFEVQSYRRDGRPIWLSGNVRACRDADGQVRYYEGTVEDITERKQAEQERERLIGELDAFAHMVAHNLKNPLGVLIGTAALLEGTFERLSKEELQETLQTMVRNGHKMNSIIDELLLLASAYHEEVAMRPLDMAGIVAEVQRRLRNTIEARQVEIIAPATWPTALGHAPWVEEVWVNYLSNAIKYGGQPPRLELGATERGGGRVCFWVRDNGRGLTPEERARLFTPFTRLNKTKAHGYGLGLAIVRRIVERLGGQVGVESQGEPGRGSVFSFTLPGDVEMERA